MYVCTVCMYECMYACVQHTHTYIHAYIYLIGAYCTCTCTLYMQVHSLILVFKYMYTCTNQCSTVLCLAQFNTLTSMDAESLKQSCPAVSLCSPQRNWHIPLPLQKTSFFPPLHLKYQVPLWQWVLVWSGPEKCFQPHLFCVIREKGRNQEHIGKTEPQNIEITLQQDIHVKVSTIRLVYMYNTNISIGTRESTFELGLTQTQVQA